MKLKYKYGTAVFSVKCTQIGIEKRNVPNGILLLHLYVFYLKLNSIVFFICTDGILLLRLIKYTTPSHRQRQRRCQCQR